MDCGEVYIKMCEKAEEIQTHKFEYGDWFAFPSNSKFSGCGVVTEQTINVCNVVWLPRQDQLQEMICPKQECLCSLTQDFFRFVYEEDGRLPLGKNNLNAIEAHYTSMEQLWLVVLMRKKYNKIWDGENWIS